MIKIKTLALSVTTLALLVGCDSDSLTDEEVLDDGGYVMVYTLDGQTYELRQDSPELLEIACPAGEVCDETYDYRAHTYADGSLSLYLSFTPQLVGDYSYQSIVEHFNYADIRIPIPMLSTDNSEVYFQPLEVLRELSFNADIGRTSSFRLDLHDFGDGYLSGTWKGVITELTEHTEDVSDETCYTDDIQGECYETIPVNMPFTLHFNLKVEQ